jgi:NitT/TauT family transport system substrate-binding protein
MYDCKPWLFLGGLAVAAAARLLGLHVGPVAAEPPPETTRLRLEQIERNYIAPQYVAEELLHVEGFTEVQYVKTGCPPKAGPGSVLVV